MSELPAEDMLETEKPPKYAVEVIAPNGLGFDKCSGPSKKR